MDTLISLFPVVVISLPCICIKEPHISQILDMLVSGAALSMLMEEALHDMGALASRAV